MQTAPGETTREGYEFKGWTLNGKDVADPFSTDSDVKLTAKWEGMEFTVNFNSAGGTPSQFKSTFKTGEKSYELRNANFKGYIGPKSIAIIHACGTTETEKKVTACVVFEGFFNMLTYVQLLQQGSPVCIIEYPCDMIVLNSAGFAPHAQPIFDEYGKIHCYLDNDKTGHCKTLEILDRNPGRATDESCRYESYNDLNDYLCGRIQFKPEDVLPED